MIVTILTIECALQGLSASASINDVKRALLGLGVTPLRNRQGLDMEARHELDIEQRTEKGCTSWTRVVVEIFRGEHSYEAPTSFYYKIK